MILTTMAAAVAKCYDDDDDDDDGDDDDDDDIFRFHYTCHTFPDFHSLKPWLIVHFNAITSLTINLSPPLNMIDVTHESKFQTEQQPIRDSN